MNQPLTLEDDLRRALAARAARDPLPADALRVPPGWVAERPSPAALLGRTLAFVTVAAAAVIVVAQLSGFLNRTDHASVGSVAATLGLPQRQVLETRDGFLAVRFSPSRAETVELVLVPAAGDPQVLASGALSLNARGADVVSLGTFPVSCSASSGLAQPNVVFGYVQFAGAAVDQITLDLAAESTINHGLFLFALDPGKTPTSLGSLTAKSTTRPDLGGLSEIAPSAFSNDDACGGEAIQALD